MTFLVRPVVWSEKDTIPVQAETAEEAVKKWPDEVIAVILSQVNKKLECDIDWNTPERLQCLEIYKNRFKSLQCIVIQQ